MIFDEIDLSDSTVTNLIVRNVAHTFQVSAITNYSQLLTSTPSSVLSIARQCFHSRVRAGKKSTAGKKKVPWNGVKSDVWGEVGHPILGSYR